MENKVSTPIEIMERIAGYCGEHADTEALCFLIAIVKGHPSNLNMPRTNAEAIALAEKDGK